MLLIQVLKLLAREFLVDMLERSVFGFLKRFELTDRDVCHNFSVHALLAHLEWL